MVAPVTGNDIGIRRAEIKQGIREAILCKDQDGKIGLRLKSVDNVSIEACFCLYRSYCWIKLVVELVYGQRTVYCIILACLLLEFENPLLDLKLGHRLRSNFIAVIYFHITPGEYL